MVERRVNIFMKNFLASYPCDCSLCVAMASQDERTCPVRISRPLHERVKAIAAKRGMKLQALADIVFEVWLALPEKKRFKL